LSSAASRGGRTSGWGVAGALVVTSGLRVVDGGVIFVGLETGRGSLEKVISGGGAGAEKVEEGGGASACDWDLSNRIC
jgi:hypothetical protein